MPRERDCRCLAPMLILGEAQTPGIPGSVIRPEHIIATTRIRKIVNLPQTPRGLNKKQLTRNRVFLYPQGRLRFQVFGFAVCG